MPPYLMYFLHSKKLQKYYLFIFALMSMVVRVGVGGGVIIELLSISILAILFSSSFMTAVRARTLCQY